MGCTISCAGNDRSGFVQSPVSADNADQDQIYGQENGIR